MGVYQHNSCGIYGPLLCSDKLHNKSANQVAMGKAQGGMTKYIATKYHMMQQMADEGFIRIYYVSTKRNYADGMTKALGPLKFEKFVGYCFNWFDFVVFKKETGNGEEAVRKIDNSRWKKLCLNPGLVEKFMRSYIKID